MSTTLKLLHRGLSVKGHAVAEDFSRDELVHSPLGQGLSADSWHAHSDTVLEKEMDLTASIYLAGRATSSLDLAHELFARNEFPVWSSALVLQQSAGRGQMRREWVSPPGNIYAALRLPLAAPFNNEAAAPALGVFMAQALEALGFQVGLKWPNDILQVSMEETSHNDLPSSLEKTWHAGNIHPTLWRKAGGILLEERNGALIAGIGLNLNSCPDANHLREGFALTAGRLFTTGQTKKTELTCAGMADSQNGTRNNEIEDMDILFKNSSTFYSNFALVPLWAQLVKKIFLCYSSADYSLNQSAWLPLAQKFLAFKGWKVRLDDAAPEDFHVIGTRSDALSPCERENRTVIGWMEGLSPSGALRLRTENGLRTFFGGSLTPLP